MQMYEFGVTFGYKIIPNTGCVTTFVRATAYDFWVLVLAFLEQTRKGHAPTQVSIQDLLFFFLGY
jgi:hypothetical protein